MQQPQPGLRAAEASGRAWAQEGEASCSSWLLGEEQAGCWTRCSLLLHSHFRTTRCRAESNRTVTFSAMTIQQTAHYFISSAIVTASTVWQPAYPLFWCDNRNLTRAATDLNLFCLIHYFFTINKIWVKYRMLVMPLGSKASSGTLTVKQRRNNECMVICTRLRFSLTHFTVRLSNSHWEAKNFSLQQSC